MLEDQCYQCPVCQELEQITGNRDMHCGWEQGR